MMAGSDQRRRFGQAVQRLLGGRPHRWLAERVNRSSSAVSLWVSGKNEPDAETVFRVESALDVPPGTLSSMLGYVPVGASDISPEDRLLVAELRALLTSRSASAEELDGARKVAARKAAKRATRKRGETG